MKKLYSLSALALLILGLAVTSCAPSEEDDIFDQTAAQRLAESVTYYGDILTSQGGKWQLEYFTTENEPGYIYLFTFDKNGSVTIAGQNKYIGKLTNPNEGKPIYGSEVSLWEVITDDGPVLSFNSYNTIFHLFANPEDIPDTDDSETGYGHEGDYEFNLMGYANDTLRIEGKKYGVKMIMTRLPQTTDDETYMGEVVSMTDSFFNARIPTVYLNLPNGSRYIVENGASQIITFYPDGETELDRYNNKVEKSVIRNAIITHDGLSLMTDLVLEGYRLRNFVRRPDGSLLCRDDNQTTFTAAAVSNIFTDTTLQWEADMDNCGGIFADAFSKMSEQLQAFNKSRYMEWLRIGKPETGTNKVYSIYYRIQAKAASTKQMCLNYLSSEAVGDDGAKFEITNQDNNAKVYYNNVEAIKTIIDAFNGGTFKLEPNSILAPIRIKVISSTNPADYLYFNLR